MNDTDDFLKEVDYTRVTILLKNNHKDFLKNIDKNNVSNSIRVIIDRYMKMTKRQIIERYLLYIVFILCIFTAGTLFLNMI